MKRPAVAEAIREGDLGEQRVIDQRLAGLDAEAGHDIDRPRREAGLVDQLRQPEDSGGGVLGRLDHHGVAGAERGGEFAGGEGER